MVESIKELRKICQTKSHKTPKTEYFSRKFSIYLTKIFLNLGISANQVTIMNMIVGLAAGVFLLFGYPWALFAGGLLLQLASILDCSDGEVARYRGTAGPKGLYMDRLNHNVVLPFVFAGLTFGIFNNLGDYRVFIFGFLACISISLVFLVVYSMYASAVDCHLSSPSKAKKASNLSPHRSGVEEVREGIISSSSNKIYEAVDFMLPGASPGWIWLLLAVSVVDAFVPSFSVGGFVFSGSYLYLILYGSLLPLAWIGMALQCVKKNSCEKLVFSLAET